MGGQYGGQGPGVSPLMNAGIGFETRKCHQICMRFKMTGCILENGLGSQGSGCKDTNYEVPGEER